MKYRVSLIILGMKVPSATIAEKSTTPRGRLGLSGEGIDVPWKSVRQDFREDSSRNNRRRSKRIQDA